MVSQKSGLSLFSKAIIRFSQMEIQMKALIRTKQTYRPFSQERTGFRLQACIPNMQARKMKRSNGGKVDFYATAENVPSFTGQYLIAEGSDYATAEDIKPADVQRFVSRLLWLGYTEFEQV